MGPGCPHAALTTLEINETHFGCVVQYPASKKLETRTFGNLAQDASLLNHDSDATPIQVNKSSPWKKFQEVWRCREIRGVAPAPTTGSVCGCGGGCARRCSCTPRASSAATPYRTSSGASDATSRTPSSGRI